MMRRGIFFAFVLQLALSTVNATPSSAISPVLAVIAHPSVKIKRLEYAELKAIFTVSQKRWDNGVPAVPFNYPPENSLRSYFDRVVLDMDPVQVAKFWIDQRIRGKARPPRHVISEALMSRVVAALPGAVGYVREEYISSGVVVVALIVDGQISPPHRAKGISK